MNVEYLSTFATSSFKHNTMGWLGGDNINGL